MATLDETKLERISRFDDKCYRVKIYRMDHWLPRGNTDV